MNSFLTECEFKIMRLITIYFLLVCTFATIRAMQTPFDVSILIDAAQKGETYAIFHYIAAGGNINARHSNSGSTALMEAALYGHEIAFGYLLRFGADPDVKDMHGDTVLFYSRCTLAMFKEALKAGADPNVQNKLGQTPLMYLINNSIVGFPRLRVALLLKYGAKTDIVDKNGKTVFDYVPVGSLRAKLLSMTPQELEEELRSKS